MNKAYDIFNHFVHHNVKKWSYYKNRFYESNGRKVILQKQRKLNNLNIEVEVEM